VFSVVSTASNVSLLMYESLTTWLCESSLIPQEHYLLSGHFQRHLFSSHDNSIHNTISTSTKMPNLKITLASSSIRALDPTIDHAIVKHIADGNLGTRKVDRAFIKPVQ
jgi:hypothetical protein